MLSIQLIFDDLYFPLQLVLDKEFYALILQIEVRSKSMETKDTFHF